MFMLILNVGLIRDGDEYYVAEVADRSDTNQFSYYCSTSGYYIIEVQGLGSSNGNYRIKYNLDY